MASTPTPPPLSPDQATRLDTLAGLPADARRAAARRLADERRDAIALHVALLAERFGQPATPARVQACAAADAYLTALETAASA